MSHAKIIEFADDTVLYVSSKHFEVIENELNSDLKQLAQYFPDNHLVINLKKGKSESMLFGTAKRLSSSNAKLNLYYNHTQIASTTSYKYLGTLLDSTLSLNGDFDKTYKKASGKLRLLSSLKNRLDPYTIKRIYTGIILPTLLYNCVVNLRLTQTQLQKLISLDKRVSKLIGGHVPSIANERLKHAALLVRKCLDENVCENFHGYFSRNIHRVSTRNNGLTLHVPRVKLEVANASFFSMGVRIFNSLPIEIRQVDDFNGFRKLCRAHFE